MKMNLRYGKPAFALFVILFLTVLAAAQDNKTTRNTALFDEAKKAIDKGNRQWIDGWEKGDAATVASIFSEDGSMLGSKGKIYKGYQQIFERQKAAMKFLGAGVKVEVTTTSLWVDGETAYETGKYVYKYQENGKPAIDEGRYATIWKRQKDGSWKLFLDMAVP